MERDRLVQDMPVERVKHEFSVQRGDKDLRWAKQLAAENRLRERSLSRGVVDGREIDGNARAIQQIERLEAELGVWNVKNGSLQTQVHEAEMKLRRAHEH